MEHMCMEKQHYPSNAPNLEFGNDISLKINGDFEEATIYVPIDYSQMKLEELKAIAEEKGLEGYKTLKKAELIQLIEGTE